MLLWIWAAVLISALALFFRQRYSRFTRYGVKGPSPVPPFGNMLRVILRLDHFVDDINRTYNNFSEERFFGRFELLIPMVMIRDLDLVKKVTIKDFEHFLDHRGFGDEVVEPLFARNLFSLKGQEWKDMRSTLSPAFTSSKIKVMVPFMEEVGQQMIAALKKRIKNSDVDYLDVDCKDLTTRYANDVIASCAFGLKINSHTEGDNEFYEMGKVASSFKFKQLLLFLAYNSCPALMRKLKIPLFSEDSKNFFRNIVINTMNDREVRNIIRPDMIHLLMEVKKGKLSHEEKNASEGADDAGFATVEESSVGKKNINRVWSDDDLIAQAVLFFIAGFETISSAMSFALHEIALNLEVQERLAAEIKENDRKGGGKLDYTSIQNMTYLDMVVSEVLRKWPPALALDRVCVKDYNLGRPNDKSTQDYIIRQGETIGIPVWSFHRDPQYFPNPDKFDPERFSEGNKHNIHPFSYMPFGAGPRNCIGSRFALCEVKVLLYQILQHMVISPSERTCIPSQLSAESINLRLKGGHWLRFGVRT